MKEASNKKFLDKNLEILNNLSSEEIFICNITIFFYLSNIAEQVLENIFLDEKNISIHNSNKKLIFSPVFTAHQLKVLDNLH